MTRSLRRIGYWDGRTEPTGWPDICEFVDTTDGTALREVAAYLRSGTVLAAAAGISRCRLCGTSNGTAELTDGRHFIWPEGLAHYVEAHSVRLPDEVVAVAAQGTAPPVDLDWFSRDAFEAGETVIDADWWRGRTGGATAHLPGCRHNPTVPPWELPTSAEIFVDQVPDGSLAVLMKIRRLLGATWPSAELRGLLGTQPFHAATGNPAKLHGQLTTEAELRPYLFYDTGSGLQQINPG